jgi:hypothetical protein
VRALPAVALLLLLPWPAAAASFALTPGERTEALRVGARSVTQEAFDRADTTLF